MYWNMGYSWYVLKNHFANSENWTPTQTAVFDALYNANVPFLGAPWKAAADYYYGSRQADEYRDRYGISGGGHDPRKLAGMSGSPTGMFSGGMNFVSKNLDMLYKDKKTLNDARIDKEVRRRMRDYYNVW